MLFALLFLIIGFGLLIKGADWMVDGSSSIARRFGISDLAIGLTIVAFGTSMPELIVNIFASLSGSTDIAIGNVVGSNIANILLILGATALIAPLAVQSSSVRKEIPFSLLAAITLMIMANDGIVDGYTVSELGRGDGMAFIGFFIIFLYYTFGISKNSEDEDDEQSPATHTLPVATLLTLAGIGGLIIGGKLSVDSAVTIASSFGVSQAMIGLTVVAVGTSLPELVSSIVAARKGKADIAVGNVVGSNIFNVFWILGVSAIIKPLPFSPSLNADLLTVVGATLLLLFVTHQGYIHRRLFFWRHKHYGINRWEGGVLLGAFVAYMAFVVWRG